MGEVMTMFRDEDRRRVMQEIKQVKADVGDQKPNEATTCSWVIEPLLLAAGYRRTEWVKESTDSTGNKPDYTVLPWTEHRWLLEAKAWSHTLSEQDANQLTSYANTNNIRWAVLTNGKAWQLYDASIFGTVSERLMAQSTVDEPDALADLLLALSPESIRQGITLRFARRSRMDREIKAQFADVDSPIVLAIVEKLKERTKIEYSPQEVVEYLHSLIIGGIIPSPPPPPPVVEESLAQLYTHARDLTFSKPCTLIFPDGTVIEEKIWKRILARALEKWAERYTIPVPFFLESSRKYYLTNHEPVHSHGKAFESTYEVRLPQQTFYVNTFADADRVVRELYRLVNHFGEDPATYVVRYRPAGRHKQP